MYLNLFRQDIKKVFLLIAFQQSLNSGQKTAYFRRYWQILVKNCCRFTAGDLKAFFLFFAKGLKSEGERLKVEFWSSEMLEIGRGQQNYRCCRCRHRLQSFATMKKTVKSDQQWMPWEILKKISLLAVAILFLFTFFNLIFDAPRTYYAYYSKGTGVKGTQEWEFFWLRFWILYYFIVSYA